MAYTWSYLIAAGFILMFVAYLVKRGRKTPNDYRDIFLLGVVWAFLGILLGVVDLLILGILFFLVGASNRGKWRKDSRLRINVLSDERIKIFVVLVIAIALVAVICAPKATTQSNQALITLSEAQRIANAGQCGWQGAVTGNAIYSAESRLWYVGMEPHDAVEGCVQKCVIDETTGFSEVVWDCSANSG